MIIGHHQFRKNYSEIACQPRAVIRVGIKKGENKGHQSIGNLHLDRMRCFNFTIRRINKEANKFDR
jgi:hypothetical protein